MNTVLQQRIEKSARHYLLNEHKSPLNEMLHQCDLKTEMQYHRDIENAYVVGATFALQNQWISVKEALPPHKPIGQNQRFSLPVLLIKNNDVTTAYIDSYDFEQPSENVTHWMPIPSLKGGKE